MKELTARLYIGDTPIEDLSEAERNEFAKEAAERLGKILDEIGAAYEQSCV